MHILPLCVIKIYSRINPSNAEATFVQSTRKQDYSKTSKPCCVGIHWRALAEYSQMITYMSGFQSFFRIFASFFIGQITTSSMRASTITVNNHAKKNVDQFLHILPLCGIKITLGTFLHQQCKLLDRVWSMHSSLNLFACENIFLITLFTGYKLESLPENSSKIS